MNKMDIKRANNNVNWYLDEITSRIIAESGKPSDRYHAGKIIYKSLADDQDFILQIDAGTGQSESSGSVLRRMIQCAKSFKKSGLKTGDSIVLMAPNHIDISIPFYAGFYSGIIIAPTDRTFGILELKNAFELTNPKLVFCQSEKATDIQIALNEINSDARIVSFDGGDYLWSFKDFLEIGDDVEDVGPADLDPEEALCLMIPTSGTTGHPKVTACTHKNMTVNLPTLWARHKNFPRPLSRTLIGSPLQWLTAILNFVTTAVFRITRIQTSLDFTKEHCHDIINNYRVGKIKIEPDFTKSTDKLSTDKQINFQIEKQFYVTLGNFIGLENSLTPASLSADYLSDDLVKWNKLDPPSCQAPEWTVLSPTLMTTFLLEPKMDFSSFNQILLGGSAVSADLIKEIKETAPNIEVFNGYGLSEAAGLAFANEFNQPVTSSGKPLMSMEYRLINPITEEIIREPDTPGELMIKGPGLCLGYYKNEEATREAFSEDGWFKTGDLFYRDANDFFFFVERIKLLLKYKSYQISPVEIENVIRGHPGVMDVAVSSVPSPTCGDLPVAIVVAKQGYEVTAEDIKDIVKDSLSDAKQLRGGVIFLDNIPMTSTTKVHRRKLKELVLTLPRE